MSTLAAGIAELDATDQAQLVRRGELSARELVESAIERIEQLNPALNAVVIPLYERALAKAATATGPFAGVPYLLKDLVVEVAGTPFREGSIMLKDNVSRVDSALVRRVEAAGLVIVGRTNSAEFGLLPACEPVLHGPTRNPWDPLRSTSGSSGGSAAAVASRMVPMAHANDLGGSIRYPASACGLFGLKPSRARVSLAPLYGDVVNGWAVEHAVTRSVRDSAALLDATSGGELGDPYLAPLPARPFTHEVGVAPGRLRVAYSSRTADGTPAHPACIAALEDAAALCESLGHDVEVSAPPPVEDEVGEAIGTMFDAAASWIVEYWVRLLGREPADGELEPTTRALWEEGQRISAARYLHAVEVTQSYARRVARWLAPYDCFLNPTLSSPPALLGEITSTPDDPMRAVRRGGQTIAYAQIIANITGNPAMSVPLWWNRDGLPIGVHFLGNYGAEAPLIRLAAQLERARPWSARVPPVHA